MSECDSNPLFLQHVWDRNQHDFSPDFSGSPRGRARERLNGPHYSIDYIWNAEAVQLYIICLMKN